MALTDEVQNRYSSQVLINASNPQNTAATTLDTTRLNNAITDIQAWFKLRGMTYDNTKDVHVVVATHGVYARLLVMTGQIGATEEWAHFLEAMDALRQIDSRDRISPTTDSLLTATEDDTGDLPAFDRKRFDGYVPRPPSRPATGQE